MKQLERVVLAAFSAALLAGCADGPIDSATAAGPAHLAKVASEGPTLIDALAAVNDESGEFSTLLVALHAAGLDEELSAVGQRTLFAPTDGAFSKFGLTAGNIVGHVGEDLLRAILLRHVTAGRRLSVSLESVRQLRMADGAFVPVSATDDGVFVDYARILAPDMEAGNGVVHGIDDVLVPEGIVVPRDPPFWGTIFIHPDILTQDDPTAFESLTPAGTGGRWMFDRRSNSWVWKNALLFDVTFDDGLSTEVQVNPEFDATTAEAEALKYAREIGRLPTALRKDVQTVWIHMGTQPFGGGNNNILIHTGQAALYEADGILHETLLHEATHTSLDAEHRASAGWLEAQAADGNFISLYARDYPAGEDLAETIVPWFAVRYAADRIPKSLYDTIVRTIPNRLEYLDAQGFDMHPVD